MRAGFRSIPVRATIGCSTWSTSIFPHKGSNSFVLPIKADIRRAEGLSEGSDVVIDLRDSAGRDWGEL